MNETLQVIKNRRSTRQFAAEQLKEEEISAIIEAGVYAPSATNKQPWHFTVVQNKEILNRLNHDFKELAKKSDNDYIKRVGENEKFNVFYNAPTVVLILGDKLSDYADVDCAAAAQNILLAAEALEIGSCWIGFIAYLLNSEEGKHYMSELGIPEGYRQIHAVALGYRSNNRAMAPSRKENTVNYVK